MSVTAADVLVFEGKDVLVALLENAKDSIQDILIAHGQIVLVFLVHGLNLQNDDLSGVIAGGQQDQIFFAVILDAVQILKLGFVAFFVGQGEQVDLFFSQFFICHGGTS